MPKPQSPNTEIVAAPDNDRRHRRRWSSAEKKRILDDAAKCTERGQFAELLRVGTRDRGGVGGHRLHLDEFRFATLFAEHYPKKHASRRGATARLLDDLRS